jgi:hypothetical protein
MSCADRVVDCLTWSNQLYTNEFAINGHHALLHNALLHNPALNYY